MRDLVWVLLPLGLLLSACALPRGAAMQAEVTRGATSESRAFQLVPLDRARLQQVSHWPAPAAPRRADRPWPQGGLRSADPVSIAPGDQLQLTIFDNEDNSLLTSAGQKAMRIENLTVTPAGEVFLPYAGAVKVAGLGPEMARARVQAALVPSLPSVQLLLDVRPGPRNMAEIIGAGVMSESW